MLLLQVVEEADEPQLPDIDEYMRVMSAVAQRGLERIEADQVENGRNPFVVDDDLMASLGYDVQADVNESFIASFALLQVCTNRDAGPPILCHITTVLCLFRGR